VVFIQTCYSILHINTITTENLHLFDDAYIILHPKLQLLSSLTVSTVNSNTYTAKAISTW